MAASDSADQIAYFSNWGKCVEIIGPGVNILGPWINGGTNTISGTSMASPHVAGVIAKYLTDRECSGGIDRSPEAMLSYIQNVASKDKISGLTGSKAHTPNQLIFMDCK